MSGVCFVAMPFGGDHDLDFQRVISPAIRDAGFTALRADEIFSSGNVIDQIWRAILEAEVVLADTTGRNANVYYELGLAHAARRPVLLITQEPDDIPFDLRSLRHIGYRTREAGWDGTLRDQIRKGLKEILVDRDAAILSTFDQRDDTPIKLESPLEHRLVRVEEAVSRLAASFVQAEESVSEIVEQGRRPAVARVELLDGRWVRISKTSDEVRLKLGHLVVSIQGPEDLETVASQLLLDSEAVELVRGELSRMSIV